jgi:hypothetical protein
MKRINSDRIDYIRGLFKSVSDIGSRDLRERKLQALCERLAGVSDPRFLTTEGAAKIILELTTRRHRKFERNARAEKILLHGLSRREKEIVRKENPFRKKRDDLLRRLRGQGISYSLLSLVSGLGETRIYMILRKGVQ